MEMKLRHWLGVPVAACALFGIVSLPPERPETSFPRGLPPSERAFARRIGRHLATAQTRLRLAERRDAALTSADAEHGDGRFHVVIDDEVPEAIAQLIQADVEDVGRGFDHAADARVIASVWIDSASSRGNLYYVLPKAADGRSCLMLMELGRTTPRLVEQGLSAEDALRVTFRRSRPIQSMMRGPCVFFAVFGQPGPQIETWLEGWHYVLADLADWDRPPATPLDADRGLDSWMGFPYFEGSTMGSTGFDATACGANLPRRCRSVLLGTPPTLPYLFSGFYTWGPPVPGWVKSGLGASVFGPATSHFLSDVVRDIGPERFREFWTSDLPVDQAFAAAVGTDIGSWTAEWLGNPFDDYRFGPGVSFSGVLVVALLAGLGAFAGVVVAAKRKAG